MQDAGKTWWKIDKLSMTGLRQTKCTKASPCTYDLALAKAEFLTSTNGVVATLRPPYNWCRDYLYDASKSVLLQKCAVGPTQISVSATKIRFSWQFFTKDQWGNVYGTPVVTRTVGI